jgi:RNA polymerase II subunit A-like phosphatase
MSSEFHLPLNLPFPIKIVSLDARPPRSVLRGTRLFSYSFVHTLPTPNAPPETRYGTWDSPVDGTLDAWRVKAGENITAQRAKDKPVVVITEPCTHEAQIAGQTTRDFQIPSELLLP